MAPLRRTAAFLWAATAVILCFGVAVAQDPQMGVTYFDNLPGRLFFFEDTPTAVYHDLIAGEVFITQDEGNTWDRASDIPRGEAMMVIEHPFDTRYAFVLTSGTTHFRTEDRGRTWRPFDVPSPPAYTTVPLSFHSDPAKWGYVLYQGTECSQSGWDRTYYTTDGFSTEPEVLLRETTRCQFAHSSKDFKHDAHPDFIYCVAHDTSSTGPSHSITSSRLFSSTDFFRTITLEDFGTGRSAKGVVALAIVSKFAVVALRDTSPGASGDMMLYVTLDTKEWAKAQFPHASQARLRENAYTIVESTIHSLAVDVLSLDQGTIGTLFVSNSNGTYFVESLPDTNRNARGYVDYENVYGIEGVGIANVVANPMDVERKGQAKKLKSLITFNGGSSWAPLRAPDENIEGKRVACSPSGRGWCSLHLHSVTNPHNFGRIFSSPAPGLVIGVGSIGQPLAPYDECDTFLSTDAGLTWKMIQHKPHMYEFGDSGSIILLVNDDGPTEEVLYSLDFGNTWRTYNLGMSIRARGLTAVSDATSQKFMLLVQIPRHSHQPGEGHYGIIYLDFAGLRTRKCEDDDFEQWFGSFPSFMLFTCVLIGFVKQWYKRRKPYADCYVGDKFMDPVVHEEPCPCEEHDYECDYNYVRSGDICVPSGLERIPSTQCTSGQADETYMGSSGYRLVAGNKCDKGRGLRKDEPVSKPCSQAQPAEGEITNSRHEFPAEVLQYQFFKESSTIIVHLSDYTIWQSSNEGFTWEQKFPDERFVAFYMHTHANDRAYLLTDTSKYYYTTDGGRYWLPMEAPSPPNTFRAAVLSFQPRSDYLIWVGNVGCDGTGERCRAEARYSRDHGRNWDFIDDYVVQCAWARDEELKIDSTQILCESYRKKEGSQRTFGTENPLQLISGGDFYSKKTKLFNHVVGFTKFSEYLIVAEYLPQRKALDIQVSLDGRTFATGQFPPGMHPNTHAYTILESSTDSIFLHMTMSEYPSPYWGNILKSNSNGTYFGLSIENVNRDQYGYVDFEKFVGLDGIALVNVVADPTKAALTGKKTLQSRITHNDGERYLETLGATGKGLARTAISLLEYGKSFYRYWRVHLTDIHQKCALHVHGYTERTDARATYSSPAVVGVVMAVGNVGEVLAPYLESGTFLSRDGGFTWEEVHKDAHLWEFGDSGSVIVLVNDEEPTDHVLFTTDEGLTWREYRFSTEKLRIKAIVTVPEDTSRKFMLLGYKPQTSTSTIIHLDFTSLTHKQCVLNVDDPGHDDFELWSPSEERQEVCLFGRQTLYHRRKREANCVVGKIPKVEEKIVRNCACTVEDFECEFNYVKDSEGNCVLVSGTTPLASDNSCRGDDEYWYERTAYRKVPYSSCEGGWRPDQGTQHLCPGIKGHSTFFWLTVLLFPFAITALIVWWWYKKSGLARGTIRLPTSEYYWPDGMRRTAPGAGGALDTLASVPWFLLGVASIAYAYISSSIDALAVGFRSRRGYRDVPVDEDAQILRFEDEE
ncbi:hypothetical protein ID866_8498 [Astraeus odoratus]|nr:hypothetical protein ID866_8498 [Astraeus odoratus]